MSRNGQKIPTNAQTCKFFHVCKETKSWQHKQERLIMTWRDRIYSKNKKQYQQN